MKTIYSIYRNSPFQKAVLVSEKPERMCVFDFAKVFGFPRKRVEKLVNHSSKKFTFINCKQYELRKTITEQ